MKKNYVSLNVQVIDVQLSDCIAGSGRTSGFQIKGGKHEQIEVSGAHQGGNDNIGFGEWNPAAPAADFNPKF